MGNKIKRVDKEFDKYIQSLQIQVRMVTGRPITYTQATQLVARMNQSKVIVVPKRRKKGKRPLSGVFPFADD